HENEVTTPPPVLRASYPVGVGFAGVAMRTRVSDYRLSSGGIACLHALLLSRVPVVVRAMLREVKFS
ncbi:hypothetical protein RA997_22995, partial [Mycobacteroides abscessus subsp. abscessus]|uniref:hypothetical protein n=1 Tax=Mycobacteroides abscessus TaxID=36809 RepID=UPI003CF98337